MQQLIFGVTRHPNPQWGSCPHTCPSGDLSKFTIEHDLSLASYSALPSIKGKSEASSHAGFPKQEVTLPREFPRQVVGYLEELYTAVVPKSRHHVSRVCPEAPSMGSVSKFPSAPEWRRMGYRSHSHGWEQIQDFHYFLKEGCHSTSQEKGIVLSIFSSIIFIFLCISIWTWKNIGLIIIMAKFWYNIIFFVIALNIYRLLWYLDTWKWKTIKMNTVYKYFKHQHPLLEIAIFTVMHLWAVEVLSSQKVSGRAGGGKNFVQDVSQKL